MSRILYYNGDFITLEKEMPQANYVMTVDGMRSFTRFTLMTLLPLAFRICATE